MLYLVYLKINLRPILIYFFSFLLQVKTSKRTYSRLVLVHLFSFLPQVKVIFFKLFFQMIAKIRLIFISTIKETKYFHRGFWLFPTKNFTPCKRNSCSFISNPGICCFSNENLTLSHLMPTRRSYILKETCSF